MNTKKFPSLLKYLLDGGHYRLTELAKATNLHASDLSKIVNGKRTCSARLMEMILSGIEEHHQSQLLLAWLSDQVSPEYQHLVHIVRSDKLSARRDVADLATVEGSLAALSAQADVNPAVRTLILTMAQAFNPGK